MLTFADLDALEEFVETYIPVSTEYLHMDIIRQRLQAVATDVQKEFQERANFRWETCHRQKFSHLMLFHLRSTLQRKLSDLGVGWHHPGTCTPHPLGPEFVWEFAKLWMDVEVQPVSESLGGDYTIV